MKRAFKNKLNENKNYLRKNEDSGQLTAFPLNNILAQDNLENSATNRILQKDFSYFILLHRWIKLFTLTTLFYSRKASALQFLNSILLSKTASLLSHNSCIMCKSYISALLTFLLSWLFFSINCVSYTFLASYIWALRILEALGIYGQSFLTGNLRPGLQPFQQPCHTVSEPFLPSYPS